MPILSPFRPYDTGRTWSHQEIAEAFDKMSGQQILTFRYYFFIEGVDEYNSDDYMDINKVLKSLDASSSVNTCLS